MRSAVLLFTLLSAAAPALAQPAPDPAEAAYQEGRRLYDLQEWDNAIAKFKEAYAARSDAASLFNIAQSYRLKGDCAHASSFYKTYKRNFPAAPNMEKVDKFIADLEKCAATAPAVTEPVKPVEPVVTEPVKPPEPVKPVVSEPVKPVVVTQPPARDDDPGHGKRLAGIGVGIGGVVLLGVGTAFGILASHKSSTVANATKGTVWDPSLESSGNSDNTREAIFDIIGGAAIVTGGVLYFLGRHHSPEGLALVPRREGAMLTWSCGL